MEQAAGKLGGISRELAPHPRGREVSPRRVQTSGWGNGWQEGRGHSEGESWAAAAAYVQILETDSWSPASPQIVSRV